MIALIVLFLNLQIIWYELKTGNVPISVYLKSNHKLYCAGDMQNPAQAIKQYFEQASDPF